ncbi:MAG: type I restriction enzyme HsdR N-terminal domain-containing protein [Bacteroidota bacterium]|jgi:hypothetical protein
MLPLRFADPDFQMRKKDDHAQLFDRIRKKWVKITPEEWVRQNMVVMLINELKISSAHIGVEKEIIVGELKKRFDILVYDQSYEPWMLIECKAPEVMLSEKTAAQMLNYQQVLRARYMVITNGNNAMGWEYYTHQLFEMQSWPSLSI